MDGYEEGKLSDLNQYYEFVSNLKKVNRRLITNYYLQEENLKEALKYGRAMYIYQQGVFFNLIIKEDGFSRLYFHIADNKRYYFNLQNDIYVCDIILKKDETAKEIITTLTKNNFNIYTRYNKWTCSAPQFGEFSSQIDVITCREGNIEVVEELFCNFDIYSDFLPKKDKIDIFISEKNFLTAYDMDNKMLGALIYSKKGNLITEDFLFVKKEARGFGLGCYLHQRLYQIYYETNMKYIAWIREDNIQSSKLHSSFNYQMEPILKLTLMKGKEK